MAMPIFHMTRLSDGNDGQLVNIESISSIRIRYRAARKDCFLITLCGNAPFDIEDYADADTLYAYQAMLEKECSEAKNESLYSEAYRDQVEVTLFGGEKIPISIPDTVYTYPAD